MNRGAHDSIFDILSGIGYFGGARMDLIRSRVKDQEVALGTKFDEFGSPEAGFRELNPKRTKGDVPRA